jgi:hypothetical protein
MYQRVRSGFTLRVNGIEGDQPFIHAVFTRAMSGQLRFLGLRLIG